MRRSRTTLTALGLVVALAASGCGSGDDDESASDDVRTTTTDDDDESEDEESESEEEESETEESESEEESETEESEEESETETETETEVTETETEATETEVGGGDTLREGFRDQVEDATGEEVVVTGEGTELLDSTEVTDDTGALTLEVPTDWSEVEGAPLDYLGNGEQSPSVVVAPDLVTFSDTFSASGVQLVLLQQADPADSDGVLSQYLDAIGAETACPELIGREDYDDGIYRGRFEIRTDCDGTDAAFAGIVAVPEDGAFVAFLAAQLVTDADFDALDRIIDTFLVTG